MTKRMALQVHPDTPCGALTGIKVEIARAGTRKIAVRYVASGHIEALEAPFLVVPGAGRGDELWRHTCFEAFVRVGPGSLYHEFNLAPSGEWACHRFDDYRHGMEIEHHVGKPDIGTYMCLEPFAPGEAQGFSQWRFDPLDSLETPFFMMTAILDLSGTTLPIDQPWHLGLSAVIEERNGNISYWALNHPPGKPDFHHPDCFALELPAARPS